MHTNHNKMQYLIGRVIQTHGIKGEVKVKPNTDFDRFIKGKTVYINELPYKINTVRNQKDLLLVSFENYPTLTLVEHLKQQDIYTDESPDDLEDDSYHLPQLIGLNVYTQDNYLVGTVLEFLEVPQGYLMRIKRLDNTTKLIPFVDAFIKSVTTDAIYIEVIEGLV